VKKIPCLFVRDFSTKPHVTLSEVTPGCEWVLNGEGVHTRKWDGTATLVRAGKVYARYDRKPGREPPPGFEPCEPAPDEVTGHWPGWVLVTAQPEYKWHAKAEAELALRDIVLADGTYELIGPKVNGNPEHLSEHTLVAHGSGQIPELPERSFEAIREYLRENVIEGLVFHHFDGRMAKIRRPDFGLAWPLKLQ
jgi:hypothetical protein